MSRASGKPGEISSGEKDAFKALGWLIATIVLAAGVVGPIWDKLNTVQRFMLPLLCGVISVGAITVWLHARHAVADIRTTLKQHTKLTSPSLWTAERVINIHHVESAQAMLKLEVGSAETDLVFSVRNGSPFHQAIVNFEIFDWEVTTGNTILATAKPYIHPEPLHSVGPGDGVSVYVKTTLPEISPRLAFAQMHLRVKVSMRSEQLGMLARTVAIPAIFGLAKDTRSVAAPALDVPSLEDQIQISGKNGGGHSSARTWSHTMTWAEVMKVVLGELYAPQWEILVRPHLAGSLFLAAMPSDKQYGELHATISEDSFHAIRAFAVAHDYIQTPYQSHQGQSGTVWQKTPKGASFHLASVLPKTSSVPTS